MTTYAIGDIQGCYRPLRDLLDHIAFDPYRDRLWLVGDLVNRGDGSLETLRFVRDLGVAAVTVLGNHDLNLLALAEQPDAAERANATLKPILMAPDCDELLSWLRHRPLMHYDSDLDWTMVHAGLAPEWTRPDAAGYAREVENILRSPQHAEFFQHMYGNSPDFWDTSLEGWERLRVITNCFTRIRFCRSDGSLDLDYKGTIENAPPSLQPWFTLPYRASRHDRIVFGHWSALGRVAWPQYNVWGIDTGCVWDNRLTALQLDRKAPPTSYSLSCGCEDG